MATKTGKKLINDKTPRVGLGKEGKVKEEVDKGLDGEAGVDPQVEQLNNMPNDPTDRPLEKVDKKPKK